MDRNRSPGQLSPTNQKPQTRQIPEQASTGSGYKKDSSRMPRYYVRDWNCGCCDQPVIYDSHKHEISCACGTIKGDPESTILRESWKVMEECIHAS